MSRQAVRRGGFTIIEALVAALILAVALTALFRVWSINFSRIQSSGEVNEAGQIARAELEWAKVWGASRLPTGTYSNASGIGTWSGAFDPSANSGAGGWVQNGLSYYTIQGVKVASASAAGAQYSVQLTFRDKVVLIGGGGGYDTDNTSIRAAEVVVRELPENDIVFTTATNLVVGGI